MAETISLKLENTQEIKKPVYDSQEMTLEKFISQLCGVNERGMARGGGLITYADLNILYSEEDDEYYIDDMKNAENVQQTAINGPSIDLSITNNPTCDKEYLILDLTFPLSERNVFKKVWSDVSGFIKRLNDTNLGGDKSPLLSVVLTPNNTPHQIKEFDLYLLELSNPIYASLTSSDINTPVNRISMFFDMDSCYMFETTEEDRNTIIGLMNNTIEEAQVEQKRFEEEELRRKERAEKEYALNLSEKQNAYYHAGEEPANLVGRAAEKTNESENM